MRWLLMRWSSHMLLLLIRSHLLLLTQRLWLLRTNRLCTLIEDSLKDPLTSRCLLSMLTMWRTDYGMERYISFMFNFNLFITLP